MSLLREVVGEASKLRAQRIALREGKRPSFLTANGSVEPKKFNPLSPAEMDNFFSNIFAGEGDLLRHQRHTRRFKVLELGEVDCIGLTDLRHINIYLASGAALYALDHAQLFPKSELANKQKAAEDSALQTEEDERENAQRTSDSVINAMIDFGSESTSEQEEPPEQQPPPPASPPSASSDTPKGSDDFSIDIPSLNNTTSDTATKASVFHTGKDTTSVFQPAAAPPPAPTGTAENILYGAIPEEKTETTSAENTSIKAPTHSKDTGVHRNIAVRRDTDLRKDAAAPEDTDADKDTGINTAMGAVAAQINEVVADSDERARDSKGRFVATVQERDDLSALDSASTEMESERGGAIDKLLQDMVDKKASDLHLSCDHPVMMRIAGQMEKVDAGNNTSAADLRNWLDPIIPAAEAAKLTEGGDINFTYALKGTGRFRINVLNDLHGIGAVLHYMPVKLKTLDELGTPEVIKKFCHLSKGLVIINGPAGSGRSTTLAAMIDVINSTRKAHLLLLEDPIEFVHPQKNSLIRQREVGIHTSSMLAGLQSAAREDPDIICTDEIKESAALLMAMRCAEAGRLVFSITHTINSISAIDSIINQFPPASQQQARYLLASTLRGIITQTLVRTKKGGLAAAWEVLLVANEAATMIKTGRTQPLTAHMIAHRVKGNILLNDSLLKLVDADEISFNTAINAAADKRALHALAHRQKLKRSA